jgi:hypothetical protein
MQKHFFTAVLCTVILLAASCRKKDPEPDPTPVVTPDPYTYNNDLQSSQDISFAMLTIADIDLMLSYTGEGQLTSSFGAAPSPADNGTTTIIIDNSAKLNLLSFNKVTCLDGVVRDGSVFFKYSGTPGSTAAHYRDYGFSAVVSFSEYRVNGWKLALFDQGVPATITNLVESSNYDPSVTNLKWEMKGKFRLIHPTDTNRNIVWDGTVLKTLLNTGDVKVLAADKQSSIMWKFAKVSYSGTAAGTASQAAFNYVIGTGKPLVRDFTCAVPSATGAAEFHPFISGIATFTIANYHPRTIDYGPSGACDNEGTVSFKGETYTVSFN